MSPGLFAGHTNRHRNVLRRVFPKSRGENNPIADVWIICIHAREYYSVLKKKPKTNKSLTRKTTCLGLETWVVRKARHRAGHAMCVTQFMTLCIRNVLNRQSHRYKADGSPEAGWGGGGSGGGQEKGRACSWVWDFVYW